MKPRRVLAIIDNAHEADAFRALPCLAALRRAYADARLVLLAAERAVAAFERSRPFDEIVASRLYEQRSRSLWRLRLKKAAEFVRLARRLGHGYDVVVTFGGGSTLLNVLARLVGRRTVGYANRLAWLLDSSLGTYDHYGDVLAQHRALLEACGVPAERMDTPVILYADVDADAARDLLREQGIAEHADVAVLHPGSDWACQRWLTERWAELADRLVDDGLAVVFTGLEREAPAIRAIRAQMRRPCVSVAGRTTLPQLQALLARARLCVSVESAVYDLALAVGVPTLVLAGTSDATRPEAAGPHAIVDRTPPARRAAVERCKERKDVHGGCANLSCPMAGLREIRVAEVLAEAGALARRDRVAPSESREAQPARVPAIAPSAISTTRRA